MLPFFFKGLTFFFVCPLKKSHGKKNKKILPLKKKGPWGQLIKIKDFTLKKKGQHTSLFVSLKRKATKK